MLNETKLKEMLEGTQNLKEYFDSISEEQKKLLVSELSNLEKDSVLGLSKEETKWLREITGVYGVPTELKDIVKRERAKVRELYKNGDINSSEQYQMNKKIEKARKPSYFGNRVRRHFDDRKMKERQEEINRTRNAAYETLDALGITKTEAPSYIMAHTDDELTETFGNHSYEFLFNEAALVFPKNRLKTKTTFEKYPGWYTDFLDDKLKVKTNLETDYDFVPFYTIESYLQPRTYNALYNDRTKVAYTLGDLLYMSDEELMEVRGFGNKSLEDINKFKDLLSEKYPETMEEIEHEKTKVRK